MTKTEEGVDRQLCALFSCTWGEGRGGGAFL